ncbi:MAG: alpha/beta hydrolase, partial [Anaerolineales bacterium]
WFVDIFMWLLDWFTEFNPAQSATLLISTESDLPPEKVKRKVDQIMADSRQTKQFKQLVHSILPLTHRTIGLQNDLLQMAHIPRYPLEEIEIPTLVMHGRFDADVPYSQAEFTANTIPTADLITLETSGHLIWLGDEWRDIEPRLVKFLKDNAP